MIIQKLMVVKTVNNFSSLYRTRRFITVVTTARQFTILINMNTIQAPTLHFFHIHFNIIKNAGMIKIRNNWRVHIASAMTDWCRCDVANGGAEDEKQTRRTPQITDNIKMALIKGSDNIIRLYNISVSGGLL